jgi:hypothetical protein
MAARRAPFIAVETDLTKDERPAVIADLGGYNVYEARGRLFTLWSWCADRRLKDAPPSPVVNVADMRWSHRSSRSSNRTALVRIAREPLHTVMAGAPRFAVVAPYLVHRSNGERPGQAPRIHHAQRLLGTIVAQGEKHAVCAAFLAKHYGARVTGGWNGGSAANKPIDTITVRDHHSLVATSLTKLYGTSTGADVRDPMPTVTGEGQHIGAVAAHLVRYNAIALALSMSPAWATRSEPSTRHAGTVWSPRSSLATTGPAPASFRPHRSGRSTPRTATCWSP